MKRFIFILLGVISLLQFSQAQLQKHDFNLSAGIFSSNFFDAVSEDIFRDQLQDTYVSKQIGEQTGALFFTYRYYPGKKLTLGVTIGLERVKGDILLNGTPEGYYYNDYFSTALELDYRYMNKRRIQIYSGIGLGVLFNDEKNELYGSVVINETDERFDIAYQLNLLGIRYGGVLGLFVEAGYGYKGLIKFGVNVQL